MQERLRVGVIAPPWLPVPPDGYGGTEAVVDQLCRGLQDAGHDVTLVAHAASTCPVRLVSVLDDLRPLSINDPAAEQRHVAAAYEILRGCDVIHDHTRAGGPYVSAADAPVVVTNHGPFDAEARERLGAPVAPNVHVVAISADHARHAREVRVAAVIHHGIDVDAFPSDARRGDHLLFLGRMSPDKGAHVAIRLARAAGVPLLLAAKMREPEERDYYRREVAPLLGGAVTYVGEASGTTKLALVASARALLNPIRWPEPFGMVMIEAMACGTPVITSPLGAAPELISPLTGFLADDDDGFVRAIRAIDTIERPAVRDHVVRSFSTARMVAGHVTLYRKVLGVVAPAARPEPVR